MRNTSIIVPSTANPQAEIEQIIELLKRPVTYREQPTQVETIETHISWIFLTNRYVYKLKKSVRFEFLDYSTPELRAAACREELRLNRRFAPQVYLDVQPIVRKPDGSLQLGGSGQVAEWVVKMRRLPADRMLDTLIEHDCLTDNDTHKLAAMLSQFYVKAPPLTVRPEDYRREIEAHVRANRVELLDAEHALPVALVKRIHASQLLLLMLAPSVLDERVCDGRIIEGHGDLRPEHICLEATPVVFDCVEFNRDFRKIDVVDELCFLAMECERIRAPQVGQKILDTYELASGDRPSAKLLGFYKAYRACVRAKVAVLRARQMHGIDRESQRELARNYLELAGALVAPLGPPQLLVVCGLSGSGKSTLAGTVSEALGLDLLRTDLIRLQLFGIDLQPTSIDGGSYEPAKREQVYDTMFSAAESLLSQGLSVVLDGAFLTRQLRQKAVNLGERHRIAAQFLHCNCSREIAQERIAKRLAAGTDASAARPELYDAQRQREEPLPENLAHLEIDTDTVPAAQVRIVIQWLAANLSWNHQDSTY